MWTGAKSPLTSFDLVRSSRADSPLLLRRGVFLADDLKGLLQRVEPAGQFH